MQLLPSPNNKLTGGKRCRVTPLETVGRYPRLVYVWCIFLGLLLGGCTDKIEATLPPSPAPTLQSVNEIPPHLKNIFLARCANCHGPEGDGGIGGTIFKAQSRSPKNWAAFLKNPQSIDKNSKKQPVKDLTEAEYAAFGEWLARITKENPKPTSK